jgi:hypothetical protein
LTSVVDVWRAVDPEARLVSGSPQRLSRPVRGVMRTRVAPPHLPAPVEAGLLVAEATLATSLDALLAALREAELRPVALLIGSAEAREMESAGDPMPVLASGRTPLRLADDAAAYLGDERGWLERMATDLRLVCAEATLAQPEVGTPAGLVATRTGRGVAVSADGELRALHARPAGRALAARFAATHARLLAGATQRRSPIRANRDGLWLLERPIRPGASVWLFDDVPMAAVDEVAAEAAAITLRALLRRPPSPPSAGRRATPYAPPRAAADGERTPATPFTETLLAVARHNGRIAPAARALGVHRNTVLYRLRRARAETGLDPRRPDDALRILGGHQAPG